MYGIALLLACVMAAGPASVSGRVVDAHGAPVAGARVFIEPGLAGAVLETTASPEGAWRFDSVPPDPTVGVFATGGGLAFGGTTVNVAPGAEISGVTVTLAAAASIRGAIVDGRKRPVKGARVTRVALLGPTKVGIPFAKLKALGFDEPVSDDGGAFTISLLPEGGAVALKVVHPEYAQEAVDDVAVGDMDVRIALSAGVLVEGEVVSRDAKTPVGDVAVIVRNAQPPHDTAVTKTNSAGSFAIRLKPGVYLYQATAPTFRSAGWERLTIKGEEPAARIRVAVGGVGQIRGKVCDAVSGNPIAGARVALETQGNAASLMRSGPNGEFAITAMAGENVIRLESAPGYQPPEQPALKAQVVEGKDLQLPTFWLAPIPSCAVQVVDANMKPAPESVVTVLRPLEFGWNVADERGQVTLRFASLPPDGTVVGMVEQLHEPLGALFAVRREDKGAATVQLFPLGAVKGRAVTPKGKPVPGAVVTGVYAEGGMPLWRTVTSETGAFEWRSVVPQVPQRAVIYVNDKASGEGVAFTLAPSETKDLGDVPVAESLPRPSLQGKPLAWADHRVLSGDVPGRRERQGKPALVVYTEQADAVIAVEGLTAARRLFADKGVLFAVVVNGAYEGDAGAIPVLSGIAPGPATTYLVGADGRVQLETFGLPPLRALQEAIAGVDQKKER